MIKIEDIKIGSILQIRKVDFWKILLVLGLSRL